MKTNDNKTGWLITCLKNAMSPLKTNNRALSFTQCLKKSQNVSRDGLCLHLAKQLQNKLFFCTQNLFGHFRVENMFIYLDVI